MPLSITNKSKMLFTKYTLLIYAVHLNLSVWVHTIKLKAYLSVASAFFR